MEIFWPALERNATFWAAAKKDGDLLDGKLDGLLRDRLWPDKVLLVVVVDMRRDPFEFFLMALCEKDQIKLLDSMAVRRVHDPAWLVVHCLEHMAPFVVDFVENLVLPIVILLTTACLPRLGGRVPGRRRSPRACRLRRLATSDIPPDRTRPPDGPGTVRADPSV